MDEVAVSLEGEIGTVVRVYHDIYLLRRIVADELRRESASGERREPHRYCSARSVPRVLRRWIDHLIAFEHRQAAVVSPTARKRDSQRASQGYNERSYARARVTCAAVS